VSGLACICSRGYDSDLVPSYPLPLHPMLFHLPPHPFAGPSAPLPLSPSFPAVPMMDKGAEEPPPFTVLVHGPPGVGKTTLIKGLIKHYTRQDVREVKGPITLIAGKARRLTFIECPQDLSAMIDAGVWAECACDVWCGKQGALLVVSAALHLLPLVPLPVMQPAVTHSCNLEPHLAGHCACLLPYPHLPTRSAPAVCAAKYADLVLLLIDGGFGFEMETFEFLNLLQVGGESLAGRVPCAMCGMLVVCQLCSLLCVREAGISAARLLCEPHACSSLLAPCLLPRASGCRCTASQR